MEMQAISGTYGIERGSVLAIAAGADAICVGGGLADEDTVLRLRDALVRAVRDGELPEERLADAAARVRALARWARRQPARRGRTRRPARGRAPAPASVWQRPAAPCGSPGRTAYEPLTEPPFVAAFTPVANIAVGDETPGASPPNWTGCCPAPGPAPTGLRTTEGGAGASGLVASVLAAAADRRIVAVVRDVHRHPWMADALDALLAARPDTVVVEMGVPQAPPTRVPCTSPPTAPPASAAGPPRRSSPAGAADGLNPVARSCARGT